jgi:chromosome segregation ATPase
MVEVVKPKEPVLTSPEPRSCRALTLEQEVVLLRKKLDETLANERATAVEWQRSQDEVAALKRQLQKVGHELEDAHEELEQYRMRLAGALTTVEGNMLDVQEKPDTIEYLRTCPTIAATVRVRRELEEATGALIASRAINATLREEREALALEVGTLRAAHSQPHGEGG